MKYLNSGILLILLSFILLVVCLFLPYLGDEGVIVIEGWMVFLFELGSLFDLSLGNGVLHLFGIIKICFLVLIVSFLFIKKQRTARVLYLLSIALGVVHVSLSLFLAGLDLNHGFYAWVLSMIFVSVGYFFKSRNLAKFN